MTFTQPYFWARGSSSTRMVRWSSVLVTPSVPALTLEDARLHCHVSSPAEDTGLSAWIRTAQEQVEQDTDLKLLTQTWDLAGDVMASGTLVLPFGPLQNNALASPSTEVLVKSYDSTGTLQTLSNTQYVVDTFSRQGRIGLADAGAWPTDLRTFQPLLVRAVFGWTSAALVPAPLLHAMRLLIGHYSEQRQAVVVNIGNVQALPLGYDALIAPFRSCALV